MSCPRDGRGEGALSSGAGAMLNAGKLRIICAEGSRRLWSTGNAPWTMGGSISAVVAVMQVTAAMSLAMDPNQGTFEAFFELWWKQVLGSKTGQVLQMSGM